MVERADFVESAGVVASVFLFTFVLLYIGTTYGQTGEGPGGTEVVTTLSGTGGLYVVGAIVIFLLSAGAAGYWASTR